MSEETGRPGDDARLRALLAELGSGPDDEPMPPEVVARLDDTLARLVAERTEGAESADPGADPGAGSDPTAEVTNVVPLRRRWASRVTAAAAAVIVLGAGGVAATNLGVFGGSSSTTASKSDAGADSATTSEALPAPGTAPDAATRRAAELGLPQVRSTSFAGDVTALVRTGSAKAVAPLSGGQKPSLGASAAPQDSGGELAAPRQPAETLRELGCPGPEITDGAVLRPVVYDGRVAVLVLHPENDGARLVEAWNCQGSRRLDSATIGR